LLLPNFRHLGSGWEWKPLKRCVVEIRAMWCTAPMRAGAGPDCGL